MTEKEIRYTLKRRDDMTSVNRVTAYKNYQAAVQHRYDVFYAGEEEIDRLYRIYSDQKG
jgi:hypothetical protein